MSLVYPSRTTVVTRVIGGSGRVKFRDGDVRMKAEGRVVQWLALKIKGTLAKERGQLQKARTRILP